MVYTPTNAPARLPSTAAVSVTTHKTTTPAADNGVFQNPTMTVSTFMDDDFSEINTTNSPGVNGMFTNLAD